MTLEQLKEREPFFGSWKLIRLIGEGAYGQVWEIEREEFGHIYKAAMKTITIPKDQTEVRNVMSSGMDKDSTSKYFEGIVKDMTREFSLMDKVKGNTNIVGYADHQVVQHTNDIGWDIFIRMELLTPLNEYLENHEMSENEAIRLGADIARAIEVCEKNNIIHRDIKVDNIFVSETGDFKLGDFGIARTMDKTSQASTQVGTKQYSAPEIIQGKKYTSNVDTYSLGMVLYRLLNHNRMPFFPFYPDQIQYSDTEMAMQRRMSGEAVPDIPGKATEINRILKKATSYEVSGRYQSAGEMKRDLEKLLPEDERRDDVPDYIVPNKPVAGANPVPVMDTTATVTDMSQNIATGRMFTESTSEDTVTERVFNQEYKPNPGNSAIPPYNPNPGAVPPFIPNQVPPVNSNIPPQTGARSNAVPPYNAAQAVPKPKKEKGKSKGGIIAACVLLAVVLLAGILIPIILKKVEENRVLADKDSLDAIYNACVTAASDPDIDVVPTECKDVEFSDLGESDGMEGWYEEVLSTLGVSSIDGVEFRSKGQEDSDLLVTVDPGGDFYLTKGGLTCPEGAVPLLGYDYVTGNLNGENYGESDLNDDGIDELYVFEKDDQIKELYTLENEKLKSIPLTTDSRITWHLMDNGILCREYDSGSGDRVSQLAYGKLVSTENLKAECMITSDPSEGDTIVENCSINLDEDGMINYKNKGYRLLFDGGLDGIKKGYSDGKSLKDIDISSVKPEVRTWASDIADKLDNEMYEEALDILNSHNGEILTSATTGKYDNVTWDTNSGKRIGLYKVDNMEFGSSYVAAYYGQYSGTNRDGEGIWLISNHYSDAYMYSIGEWKSDVPNGSQKHITIVKGDDKNKGYQMTSTGNVVNGLWDGKIESKGPNGTTKPTFEKGKVKILREEGSGDKKKYVYYETGSRYWYYNTEIASTLWGIPEYGVSWTY